MIQTEVRLGTGVRMGGAADEGSPAGADFLDPESAPLLNLRADWTGMSDGSAGHGSAAAHRSFSALTGAIEGPGFTAAADDDEEWEDDDAFDDDDDDEEDEDDDFFPDDEDDMDDDDDFEDVEDD